MKNNAIRKHRDRPVRVSIPVRAEFAGKSVLIKEFTANLSEAGIFLLTEQMVDVGTRGTLTLRVSQWDHPFTVEAEVARTVPPGSGAELSGLGIKFIDLDEPARKKLHRLVNGVCDGSVVEAIRRSIRESPHGIDQELRQRPVDQKLMLAIAANGEEIDALIRTGNPVIIQRLLDNPRLQIVHIRTIIRDPRLSTAPLMEIRRQRKWFIDPEVRYQFCLHPKAPFHEVSPVMSTLPVPRLKQMLIHPKSSIPVRDKAKELLKKKGAGTGINP